jgi:restriction system protein
MQNYSTLQIESVAILVILFLYLLYKLIRLYKKLRNRSLLHHNRTLKKLKRLSWDDFELLCMELFSKKGWNVLGNEKKGADGGVDIWMKRTSFMKQKKSAIVQCKRYDDAMVTIKVIREMYGLMHEYDADVAYIVTTSRFTKECYRFIEGKNMVLIDGNKLVQMIN